MSDKIMTKGWVHKICRKIYNELGPYHTEIVYQNAMEYELKTGVEDELLMIETLLRDTELLKNVKKK